MEESQPNFSQPNEQLYHPKHHIKVYVWIALVVASLGIAANGYLYFLRLSYLQQGAETARLNEQAIQELRANRQSDQFAGWQTYRNEEYGFEISYPNKDWRVEESASGWGAILAGFYFGPVSPHVIDTGVTTVVDMSNWGVQVWDKSRATEGQINAHPGSIQYEKNGKIYLIFSEGSRLEPQLFETFYRSFKFINTVGTGTLSGKVSIGPNCPVEREGVTCTPSPEAYAAREFIVLDSNQKEVASFHADADGNYSIFISAGTYTVVSAMTGMGYMSKDLPSTITIIAGQTTTLNIDIDTGIR